MKHNNEVLLDVQNITINFGSGKDKFKAVDDVSFKIYKGETFGLVGESGSGKTTIGRAIIRINEISDGAILYNGQKISGKIARDLDNEITRKIQMIFQDPMTSLNADEPISALDVSIRAQVLNLLSKLQKEYGLTYLFVAHDLSVVRFIADRIAVVYKGKIVELAEAEDLFNNPIHPYTQALLSAIPQPDPRKERNKKILIYDPECHCYDKDKPKFIEIEEDHFVLANELEISQYKATGSMMYSLNNEAVGNI